MKILLCCLFLLIPVVFSAQSATALPDMVSAAGEKNTAPAQRHPKQPQKNTGSRKAHNIIVIYASLVIAGVAAFFLLNGLLALLLGWQSALFSFIVAAVLLLLAGLLLLLLRLLIGGSIIGRW